MGGSCLRRTYFKCGFLPLCQEYEPREEKKHKVKGSQIRVEHDMQNEERGESRGGSRGQEHFEVYLRRSRRKENRKQQKVKQVEKNNFIKTCSESGNTCSKSGNEKHL